MKFSDYLFYRLFFGFPDLPNMADPSTSKRERASLRIAKTKEGITIHVGDKENIYLTRDEAFKLARVILKNLN
jgi:hypothetical protein